jgi:MSHA pilin protein MshA
MKRKGKVGNDAFTLIELVMVILLIGILAAVVLPKFVNLTGSANKAASQGVVGSLGEGLTSQFSKNLVNNDLSTYLTVTAGTPPTVAFLLTLPVANTAGNNSYANPFLTLPNYTTPKTGTGTGTSYNIVTTAPSVPNASTPGNSWWLDYKPAAVTALGTTTPTSAGLTCDNSATTNPNYALPTVTIPVNEYVGQIGNIDYVYSNGSTEDSYAYYMVISQNLNIDGFYLAPCQS